MNNIISISNHQNSWIMCRKIKNGKKKKKFSRFAKGSKGRFRKLQTRRFSSIPEAIYTFVKIKKQYGITEDMLLLMYLSKTPTLPSFTPVKIHLCFESVKVEVSQSCQTLSDSVDYIYSPGSSPAQHTGGSSWSLLQGNLPNPEITPGLPHCRPIPYQLSHKRSSRLLKCVAYPFIHLIFDLSHEVTATNHKRSSLRLLNAWDLCLFLKTSWSPLFQIG